jgi:hypothetical protein
MHRSQLRPNSNCSSTTPEEEDKFPVLYLMGERQLRNALSPQFAFRERQEQAFDRG